MTAKRGRPAGAKNTPADEQIRKDILRVYKRLGGVKWLEEWVRADPKNAVEFVKQGLAKVLATPMLRMVEQQPEDTPALSEFEAARRVAFALSLALHDTDVPLVVEGVVVEPAKPADWTPPSWMPPPEDKPGLPFEPAEPEHFEPEPYEAPEPESATTATPGGDTRNMTLTGGGLNQYHGSAEEHGGGRRDLIGDVRVVQRRESVAAKVRRQRG